MPGNRHVQVALDIATAGLFDLVDLTALVGCGDFLGGFGDPSKLGLDAAGGAQDGGIGVVAGGWRIPSGILVCHFYGWSVA
jgi:hypothetical protein